MDIIGLNCSTGPDLMRDGIRWLGQYASTPIHCVPNAGLPVNDGGRAFYPMAPGRRRAFYPMAPGPMAEILSEFVHPWSYAEFENQYVNVGETLRKAMTFNPYLKIFVANGYYDLGPPYFATEYTFDHLGLDEKLRQNISMEYYKAGHMMYIHMPSLRQMKKNLANFIKSAM